MTWGEPIPLPFETASIGTVMISPDGRFAAIISGGKHQLWDIEQGRSVYESLSNNAWSRTFTKDGAAFIAATAVKSLDVVYLAGQPHVHSLAVPLTIDGEPVTTPSGDFAFVQAREGVARVAPATGEVQMLDAPGGASNVAAAPKGRGVVVGYSNGHVRALDGALRPIGQLRLSGFLSAVAFGADGTLAAIGSHDGGVRIVDMVNGRLMADIRADTGAVVGLSIVEHGKWLMIDGLTHTRMVPLDPYTPLCKRAVRPLSEEEWRDVGGLGPVPALCQSETLSGEFQRIGRGGRGAT